MLLARNNQVEINQSITCSHSASILAASRCTSSLGSRRYIRRARDIPNHIWSPQPVRAPSTTTRSTPTSDTRWLSCLLVFCFAWPICKRRRYDLSASTIVAQQAVIGCSNRIREPFANTVYAKPFKPKLCDEKSIECFVTIRLTRNRRNGSKNASTRMFAVTNASHAILLL